MSDGIIFPQTPFNLTDSLILLGRRGSEAHGLYLGDASHNGIDDRDLMGIVVPPKSYYLGMKQWDVAEAINGPWDVVLYELRKFVGLLMKQNPNVLQLLWLEDEDYLEPTPCYTTTQLYLGRRLIENRLLFRHTEYARKSFVGYAHGQLKRMTAFDRPAMEKIAALEARLAEYDVDLARVAEGKWDRQRSNELNALAEQYVGLRRTYHKAYLGAKRWALVQQHGFDVKNAAHLVRLLHLGYEYLTEGRMNVRRTWDREMLIEIKTGQWKLEQVQAHVDAWFAKVEAAESVLPDSIDEERVDELVVGIVEGFHV
jgi:predicted nucleotidyltransferase